MDNQQLIKLNAFCKNTMVEHLGIEITSFNGNEIIATMPVDHRTHQPLGLLHGGASAALIETLGSVGSSLLIDVNTQTVVGIEINANHIKGVKSGIVTGKATIKHQGKSSHIWQVDISDEANNLVCTGRLTVLVINKK